MDNDEYDNMDDVSVARYKTYEEFLDKFVTNEDRIYLEDDELARDVKELYAVNKGDIKCKEDFENKKRELLMKDLQDEVKEKPLSSEGKVFEHDSFLWHLQQREYDVRNGRKSTIIFIRYKETNGREVSAYIDYRERLKTDNFEVIFEGQRDLVPRPSDLSFYNWTIQKVYSNDSTFFRVDAGPKERLSFRNNTDRKIINVDLEFLERHPKLDVIRKSIDLGHVHTEEIKTVKNFRKNKNEDEIEKLIFGYQQIVIFDYETRIKRKAANEMKRVLTKLKYNPPSINFCDKMKKEEILLYIMQDKYSVKPDKEFRINHTTLEKRINENEDKYRPYKVMNYGKHSITEISDFRTRLKAAQENVKRKVSNKICPRDYPYSVKKGYAGFSKYLFASNVCFNAMNFIATQVLINALNLNISKSAGVVFSAGMNWAIKEGLGQIGSIIFTTKYSQKIEKNAKSWRVVSIVLSSLSFLIEATSLLFTKHFLIIATTANIVKLVSLNCNFISRTAIIENFSKENNIVDLTNKFALQNNVSILLGNLVGFGLSFVIPLNCFYSTFGILSLIAVYNTFTAFKCLHYIEFNYFNYQRMCLVLEEYFKSKLIPTPEEVAKKEKLHFTKYQNIKFCLKCPEYIIQNDNQLYLVRLFNLFKDKNYFVIVKRKYRLIKLKSEYEISTFLRVNAENNDILWAFAFSFRLNLLLNKRRKINGNISYDEVVEMIDSNVSYFESELDRKSMIDKIKTAGWVSNYHTLEENYSRYHLLYKNI